MCRHQQFLGLTWPARPGRSLPQLTTILSRLHTLPVVLPPAVAAPREGAHRLRMAFGRRAEDVGWPGRGQAWMWLEAGASEALPVMNTPEEADRLRELGYR